LLPGDNDDTRLFEFFDDDGTAVSVPVTVAEFENATEDVSEMDEVVDFQQGDAQRMKAKKARPKATAEERVGSSLRACVGEAIHSSTAFAQNTLELAFRDGENTSGE
jgi:hypothetical protein